MVFASSPVLSERRLAARPVGAHRAIETLFAIRIFSSELTNVVLPTPGPPVMTSMLEASAARRARFWLSASTSLVRVSTQGIALSASIREFARPGNTAVTPRFVQWLASEEWLRGQSRANPSPHSKFPVPGENTGNFAISRGPIRFHSPKHQTLRGSREPIPWTHQTGNFFSGAGKKIRL